MFRKAQSLNVPTQEMRNMNSRIRLTKRRVAILLVLIPLLSFGIVDSRFLWTGWSPDTGGMCFMSQRHHANANVTYSTVFFGVNFTFLYWTYPPPVEYNGTTYVVVDAPYTAYFMVTFKDGTTENLTLGVAGYPLLLPFDTPRGVKTDHSQPTAGIVRSNSWGLFGGWQYTVAIIG